MLSKLKIFLYGFICCFIVLNSSTVYASVKAYILHNADYAIEIDGISYDNSDLPVLSMEGTTYIPLRRFCDIAGLTVDWNEEKNIVEIQRSVANKQEINHEIFNVSDLTDKRLTIDGKEVLLREDTKTKALTLEIDDKRYVHEAYVFQSIASENKVYKLMRDGSVSNTDDLEFRNDLYLYEILEDKTVKENIPTVVYEGMEFIDYEFFADYLLPLN